MSTYEKLRGQIALATNSPGVSTGYGQQAEYLVNRLVRHGLDVAVFSNFGQEGRIETGKTPHGKYRIYPKGWAAHSQDVVMTWWKDFTAGKSDPAKLLTLYDVWIYTQTQLECEVLSWVPLDHVTLPPMVKQVLERPNFYPITMSPHGQRQLEAAAITSTYIPHAIDTAVYKPTAKFRGRTFKQRLGVSEDTFVVSMVAANKADRVLHRKAIAEQILAFSIFHKKHPASHLYLHTDPSPAMGGFDIGHLLRACGLSSDNTTVADRDQLRIGYDKKDLAAIYSGSDVLMSASLGEGFGIPTVEAQACGTRVITSSWTASQDLAGPDSYLVEGQPFWHEPQLSWYQIPLLDSLVTALERAADAERGVSESSVEFAKGFDVERVWARDWMPLLREQFGS